MTLPAIVILSQQLYYCTVSSAIRFTDFVSVFEKLYMQICSAFYYYVLDIDVRRTALFNLS